MEEQIRGILSDVGALAAPVDDIGINEDLFTAGLTSFATVTVMLAIEETFGIEFRDTLLKRETFRSIAALIAVIILLKDDDIAA